MTLQNVQIVRENPFFESTKQQLNGDKWKYYTYPVRFAMSAVFQTLHGDKP